MAFPSIEEIKKNKHFLVKMYCSSPRQEIHFMFLCRFLLSLCFLVSQSQGALRGSSEGNCRYEIKTEGERLDRVLKYFPFVKLMFVKRA